MMFITGDTHREWNRLNTKKFPDQYTMTKQDYVFVLGDFGIKDDSNKENWWMNWLENKNFTTLFISGNHDNYDILDRLEPVEWNGGIVRKIRPSVIYLERGQVYEIDGHKIFTFGGGKSHDASDGILDPDSPRFKIKKKRLDKNPDSRYRINHVSWWERELPSQEELDEGIKNLTEHDWKVDYIFTHCAPTSIQSMTGSHRKPDVLTEYLEMISQKCDFQSWMFGHYHRNHSILGKYNCIYEPIIRIW